MSSEEVFSSAWEDAQKVLASLKPGEFDDAIIQAGQEDEAKHFCGQAMSWQQLCECKRPFRLIKRFCIQQPSGKLRVIDDAAAGGQSHLSQDGSKLDLCSAIQPGINARLLWEAKTSLQGPESVLLDRLETGGEDLPNAYRYVPMRPADSGCILGWQGGWSTVQEVLWPALRPTLGSDSIQPMASVLPGAGQVDDIIIL